MTSPTSRFRGFAATGAIAFAVLDFFTGGLLSAPLGWIFPSLTPSRRLAAITVAIAMVPLWRRFRGLPEEQRRHWPWAAGAALCFAVAILTRFLTLGWDSHHGGDGYEGRFVSPVLTMMRTGNLNHTYHEYPGLFLYLLAGAFILAFMVGISLRLGVEFAAMPDLLFYTAGRAMVALSSVVTVTLTMALGRLYGGFSTGLLAAALVCLSPLEIDTSQLIRPDVTLEMFAVLSLILMVRALDTGTLSAVGLAGFSVGLATAVKYTGFLGLPALLFTAVAAAGSVERRVQRLVLALAATGAAYLVASPYSALDLPGFLKGLADQGSYNTDPRLRPDDNMPLFYSGILVSRGLGPFAMGFALLGLIRTLRSPRTRDWILIIYAAFYLKFFFAAPAQFDRFMLPCIPVLAVWAAQGVEAVWTWRPEPGRRRRALVVATVVALLLPSAVRSGMYLRTRLEPSPRDAARAFLDSWVGRGVHPAVAVSRLGPFLDGASFTVGWFDEFDQKTLPFLANFDYIIASSPDSRQALQPFRLLKVFEPSPWGVGRFQAIYEVPSHLRAHYTPVPANQIRLDSLTQSDRLGVLVDGDARSIWRGRSSKSDPVSLNVDLGRARALGQIEMVVPREGQAALHRLIVESVSETEAVEVIDNYILRAGGFVRVFLPPGSARRLRITLPRGQEQTIAIGEMTILERVSLPNP